MYCTCTSLWLSFSLVISSSACNETSTFQYNITLVNFVVLLGQCFSPTRWHWIDRREPHKNSHSLLCRSGHKKFFFQWKCHSEVVRPWFLHQFINLYRLLRRTRMDNFEWKKYIQTVKKSKKVKNFNKNRCFSQWPSSVPVQVNNKLQFPLNKFTV